MTTKGFAAKRAVHGMLVANQASFGDVQIDYAAPGQFPVECVYLGGMNFEHEPKVAEGVGLAVSEVANVSVYVRVVARPGEVVDTDQRAEDIGAVVARVLRANAHAGGFSSIEIAGGIGDYHRSDDEAVTTLAYRFRCVSFLSYEVA